jgi:hypothetical protein
MMHGANRPSLEDVRTMSIGEISNLPADQLALLQEDADSAVQRAMNLKEWLQAAVALRYCDRAAAARRAQDKDAGTVRFEDGPVTVIADLPKRVEWDQAQLAALVERILSGGEDPDEYVDVAFKVPERKYAAWPAHIRTAFEPARAVRTGNTSFVLKLRECS